jgi:hypothetical protein
MLQQLLEGSLAGLKIEAVNTADVAHVKPRCPSCP